jgi:hypothetical protein
MRTARAGPAENELSPQLSTQINSGISQANEKSKEEGANGETTDPDWDVKR